MAAEGAHCVRKKEGAAGIVEEAAVGRTAAAVVVAADTPAERSSGGSSAQTAESPVEEAALGHAEEDRCAAGRAEDAARPATADPGSRPGDQQDLLGDLELGDLDTALDSGGCSQLEDPEAVRYSLMGVGRAQARGDRLLFLHAHLHPEAAPDAEDIRTADSAGHSSEAAGPSEEGEGEEGTGTAGWWSSSLDASAPGWTRCVDGTRP